jgi:hypothetical protein
VAGVVAPGADAAGGGGDGRDTGVGDGRSIGGGVSTMTAGTGSIATRGGGSGISSGTFIDVRAGFDVHALSASPAAKMPTRAAMQIPNP